MKTLILILTAVLIGCATPPQNPGNPEVVILSTNWQAIKQNIIDRNLRMGWMLEQETESLLLFTKVDESRSQASVLTQVLLGNSSSTSLMYEARYVLAQTASGIRVVASGAMSTQMPGGQVNRQSITGSRFDEMQNQLIKVKTEVERPG